MKALTVTLALTIVVTSAVGAQQFPTEPPPPAPLQSADFPPHREAMLANGVRMVVVERPAHPVLSVTLVMPAGGSLDPAGRAGLATIASQLLTKGADGRNAEQVAEAIAAVGGSFGAAAGKDNLAVGAGVLRDDAPLAFELVADAVRDPAFEPAELELVRNQALQGLQLAAATPGSVASRVFSRRLYGSHPYAAAESIETVRAITRDDLLAFRDARLRPQGALLVVAGQITLADAKQFAEEAFAGWTGPAAPPPVFPTPAVATGTEILLVDRPGSIQANLMVGNLTTTPTDPVRDAAIVANRILGGGSSGRLFTILREQKGYTYGAYSNLVTYRGPGHLVATAEVRTEAADSALVELLHQLRRMGSEPVSAAELDAAKSAIVGSFPLGIQTAEQIASQIADAILLGMPDDHLRTYRRRIAAVTAEQVQAASRSLIRSDAAVVVVVGDASSLRERLERIGPVTLVDGDGRPVAAAAAPVALTLHMDRLVERTDSFTVLVQGNAMGWQRSSLTRTADGWRFVEDAEIGPIVKQRTELDFTAAGGMSRLRQTGTVQGMALDVDVAYAGGRVTGSATAPGPQGATEKAVDQAVPSGVLDDNAIVPLLSALDWAPDASFTIPVFAAAQNAAGTRTLRVTGVETVSVPAGSFEAWRVEMSGGPQSSTLWITTSAPHRLVKVAPVGAPVEIVLVR